MTSGRRLAILLALGLWLAATAGAAAPPAPASAVDLALQRLQQATAGPVTARRSPLTGLVTFLSADPRAPIGLRVRATAAPEARALAFLAAHGEAFGIPDLTRVVVRRVSPPDRAGTEVVRLQQVHAGIPVTAGELAVVLRGAGVVAASARTVAIDGLVDTTPTVTPDQALAAVQAVLARRHGIADAVLDGPRLELLNRGHLETRVTDTRLAWFVEARRLDLRRFFWVDARRGFVLLAFSQLTHGLSRAVHDAANTTTLPGPLVRAEGDPPSGDAEADLAYDLSGLTHAYFLDQHGLDSFDGAGAPLISTVRGCQSAGDCPMPNAFWNGVQMVYGEGFVTDDVAAHELTHAVTEFSAGLYYYMQSGALNESFSDIFGETVDLLNPTLPEVRWAIGEDLPGLPTGIRNMMDPTLKNDAGKLSDPQLVCQLPGTDAGGVHSNSGVPNHAYALMVDGGTYNGVTVEGIGLQKAGAIQYRALSTYLLSASDFLDDDAAVRQSCADLVGLVGITGEDCLEVGQALDAVEMADPWPCLPLQAAVPPLCPAGQAPVHAFFDDLEDPASGNWAISTLAGDGHWAYPPTSAGLFATSGVNNFDGFAHGDTGDSVIAMTRDVGVPAGARLQFNHSYGFENGATTNWDGGVVEYSIDGGGAWTDAGALITAGATYGGTISTAGTNPLGGRAAFVKDSFGYTASQLDLAALAGQSVRFRFRIGTDSVVSDYGWFVDDVRLYTCAADGLAPTTTATPSPAATPAGWHRADVTVQLQATDAGPGQVQSIHYQRSGAEAGGQLVAGSSATVPVAAEGVTTLTFSARDTAGNVESPRVLPVRIDRAPPTIACAATPSELPLPKGQLVPVEVAVTVADALSGVEGFRLVEVSSSDADDGPGGRDRPGDVVGFVAGTPGTSGLLRAEVTSPGPSRVYRLVYEGRDLAGNAASCEAVVTVGPVSGSARGQGGAPFPAPERGPAPGNARRR
jgi:Zn-dependent metalloprotease